MHQRLNIKENRANILYISTSKIEHGFLPSLHSHPNLEILLITDGSGYVISSSKKREVKKHDIVVINPNSKHCEAGDGLTFLAIGIGSLDIYLKERFSKKIILRSLTKDLYNKIYNIFSLIYAEAQKNDMYSKEIVSSSADIMFYLLNRTYNMTKTDYSEASDSDLVANIKSIIDTYYTEEIVLDDIAHRLSESKSTICHRFKEETGMSIIKYKMNRQLEEAINMIEISDMSMSDVAYQTGFSSAAYFNRVFKEHYGISPKEYKRKKQNEKIV